MTPSVTPCPICHRNLRYERIHAGFSNLGYMYCDQDETVLTWDAYDPRYTRVIDKHPWMLDDDERASVEKALRPCPFGGSFSFRNLPHCPNCGAQLPTLAVQPVYFVVLGRRLDAAQDSVWRDMG
jgi:hypothetical protein